MPISSDDLKTKKALKRLLRGLSLQDLKRLQETASELITKHIRRQKRYAAIVEGVRMEYGGSGRKPDWLVKLLSEGHDLSEFLITSSDQGAQASAS